MGLDKGVSISPHAVTRAVQDHTTSKAPELVGHCAWVSIRRMLEEADLPQACWSDVFGGSPEGCSVLLGGTTIGQLFGSTSLVGWGRPHLRESWRRQLAQKRFCHWANDGRVEPGATFRGMDVRGGSCST